MLLTGDYLHDIFCVQGSGLISGQIYHTGINSSAYIVLFLSFSAQEFSTLESNCNMQLQFKEIFACPN